MPENRPPKLGERFVQTDLANTIQFMADEEKAASIHGRKVGLDAARNAFYKGDIAKQIVSHIKDYGGYLSMIDLAEYQSRIGPPVTGRWRDFEIFTCGPWCQGPTLIQCLKMLDKAGFAGFKHNSSDYLHLLVEVIKCVFADREHYFGDPDFVKVPLDWLHSDQNTAAWLARISDKQAMQEIPAPNGEEKSHFSYPPSDGKPDLYSDTSYVCVIDRWGNAFSATPSDGAEAPVVAGLGLIPSTRGTQSRTDPTHPGGIAPGKRPRLTPCPAIALRDDGTILTFGTPGGDAIVQAMVQVFLNTFHFNMDIQTAIDAPRVISHHFPSSFYPNKYFPAYLGVENRISKSVRNDLAARGHRIDLYPEYTRNCAAVEFVAKHSIPGFIRAGADPRHLGYAIVR
jgi:gamma-glutamyltranspeptidase/glutathione hydrolase